MERKHAETTERYYSGPLRWEELPPKLEARVRALYYSCGLYLMPTFEQWEIGFCREVLPERELVVWESIDAAFRDYFNEHEISAELATEVVYHLLAISLNMDKPEPLFRELKQLYAS